MLVTATYSHPDACIQEVGPGSLVFNTEDKELCVEASFHLLASPWLAMTNWLLELFSGFPLRIKQFRILLTSAAINVGRGCWKVSLLPPSGNLCVYSLSSCWNNTKRSGTWDVLTLSLSCYQSAFVFSWQTIFAVPLPDYGSSCDVSNALHSVYQLGSCGSCPYLSGHVIFGMPDTSMHT